MNTPDPKYLCALARRVWECPTPSVELDVEVEIALFNPAICDFVSAGPDSYGVRVIYRRADGTKEVKTPERWTTSRESTATTLVDRATEITQAQTAPAPLTGTARIGVIESAIRIGIFTTCIQRGMDEDAAIAIVKGTMAQLCVAAALAKGKAQ